MLAQVKRRAQKSKTAIISHHIYDNWRVKRRFQGGDITLTSGSTHATLDLAASLSYIDTVFEEYFSASGLTRSAIVGKRILEIGPGDNVGVALKFLLAGAEQVICLDRFSSSHNWQQQRRIYSAMRERLSHDEQVLFDSVIDLESGICPDSGKLAYLYGAGIEEAAQVFPPASFDWIISRAVLEHVYDPDSAFTSMLSLLKRGGYMLHKIDFRDHGMFSRHGHHPLTFLTIPEHIYRLMVYDSGKPNRKLINYYQQQAANLGLATRLLITNVVGVEHELNPPKTAIVSGVDYTAETCGLLERIRPHLQEEFRRLTDEQLMVSGLFLIAQKPVTSPATEEQ